MGRRRGKVNVKNQVDQALKKINFIGQSKKEFRDLDQDTGIHSRSQIKHAYSVNMQFAEWAKQEKGVKNVFQLKRSHYRDYIAMKEAEGVSKGHLINIETNLRLLAKGMNEVSRQKGVRDRDWIPKERLIVTTEREQARDRSYTEQEVQQMRENISDSAKPAFDFQNAFGLRLRESANVKVAHIVERDGKLYFEAVSDKESLNTAKGVTKAGRGRVASCRPKYEDRVREWIKNKKEHEYISPVRYNTLKDAYYRAAGKADIENYTGSHGFRHSYAREQLKSMLQEKGIYEKGQQMIERMLDNRSLGYRKDYGVSSSERVLYREVNRCIDRVHADLGHGRGRIDLVAIYMS
ncbi:tyrosine-type recombinase/integrase [Lentibacillus cibarius]|uniref:Tyrosine-type recombinase/integrase n=1 Tax=Lentibacillus cibarius TaxID=2583219 RepID=A0A549Y911_9BACI|nr:tyrosine-type recombinase/integrase [Lentibacillus cibarius]TRM08323.1 tyrosine-type recombinase/integrase [Lentibacillus cibarius]